ncbi:MAG: hypothetical protein IPK87_01435 [Planctomycetes bacterium]|nr:hypothetical protein [Planctomycetota bacterium]
MTEHMALALAYAALGSVVASLALQAAAALSGQYARLRELAAEKDRAVPALVGVYFRNTTRLLTFSALAFMAGAASDAVTSRFSPSPFSALVLGYGCGVFLLVCACTLGLQGLADRRLRLHRAPWRVAYVAAGMAGVPLAAFGMLLVVHYGSVWPQ